jgi:hypothetical protein
MEIIQVNNTRDCQCNIFSKAENGLQEPPPKIKGTLNTMFTYHFLENSLKLSLIPKSSI